MTCIDLPSKRSIMLSLVPKHSKQRKTTKPIKCNELHRLDVKTIKTKLNYKSDQNPMTCIDLTSKRSKMLSYVAKHSKQPKTTKPIKCNELHRYDVRTIKTKLNYKSDLNYKTHQMQWIASIGCENDQNKAKLQKWSKSNDLHRFDLKTINNVEFGLKTFKTKLNYKSGLNYKSDQNPMTCIDLPSKRSIMLSLVPKHSKQRKTTKPIKCNELHRLDVKTIKTKLNYKSDQYPMTCIDLPSKRSIMLSLVPKHSKQRKTTKPIKCNELHRLDVKTIKTKLNYKSDQNPMTCIDLTSKRSKMLSYVAKHSKQPKTTKPIKCNELHRLDVKTIKTKLNYKSDQNPMTCMDLTSKRSKMLRYVAKHSKQR